MSVTEVVAPAPGLVTKISVPVGSSVSQGETIAVLQSMKMEIEIQAEISGKVSKILIKEGDEVNIGQTIAEIE